MTVMDFASAEAEQRYRSFYPVGEMLIGLRFHEIDPSATRMRMGRSLKIIDGSTITLGSSGLVEVTR